MKGQILGAWGPPTVWISNKLEVKRVKKLIESGVEFLKENLEENSHQNHHHRL